MKECICVSRIQYDLSSVQISALEECADLKLNGYMVLFQVMQRDWWYFKLRHCQNGRTLVIQWRKDYYTISEGKNILKRFPS